MLKQPPSRIKSSLTLLLGLIATNVIAEQPFNNYQSLSQSNKASTSTKERIIYQNTVAWLDNLKTFNSESKIELDSRLAGLKSYILYPILLARVVSAYPEFYPIEENAYYFVKYWPNANFTSNMFNSVWYTYLNNGQYQNIVDLYNRYYDRVNFTNNSLCAAGVAAAQTQSKLESFDENQVFEGVFQTKSVSSTCASYLRTYAAKNKLSSEQADLVAQYITENAKKGTSNNLNQLSSLVDRSSLIASVLTYAVGVVDTPSYIFTNNRQGKYFSQINENNLRNFTKSYPYKNEASLDNFITMVNTYKVSQNLKIDAIADYIDLNYFKIPKATVLNYIKTYHTDRTLELVIRDAILAKTNYLPYIALLSKEKQSSPEWRYWYAKAISEQSSTKAKDIYKELAITQGFYGLLAAKQLGQTYKINKIMDTDLDRTYDLDDELPWYAQAIKEANSQNDTTLALSLWSNLRTDSQYTGLISWAYKRNLYYLGVNSSIRQKLWNNLSARFPDAYSKQFTLKTSNLSVTKTFAQAIARQESAWNYNAKSSAKAYGLMQFINATARKTAKTMGIAYNSVEDLLVPETAISMGTFHLSELLDSNDNNRALTAIGYNAGPARITQWLNRAGGRLNFDEFVASIPFTETRNYVMNTISFDYYYQVLQGVKSPTTIYDNEWNRKY